MKSCILLLYSSIFSLGLLVSQTYDIGLMGGRVIDPETGLDDVRNVGIRNGQIAIITANQIDAREKIDVRGLIVSPGFIDPHVHGITNEAHEYQAHDGVTTALELEGGVGFIDYWIEAKRNNSMINYGASAQHSAIRVLSQKQYQPLIAETLKKLEESGYTREVMNSLFIQVMRSRTVELDSEERAFMKAQLTRELEGGAIGIGVPVGYYPTANEGEIFEVYSLAAEKMVPVYSHVREGISGIQQAIANAATTGAPLHIVHMNSMALKDIGVGLKMVEAAQKRGFKITTEVYPYTAASTSLESVLFDEGWKERFGISYGDLQWQDTGERLTSETFYKYREKGGIIIIHMMKPEWISEGIASKVAMIGSDGMPYAPLAHPRTAGTYARVLGKYVREEGVLSLKDAIKKMTIMPAKQLEIVVPAMRLKGRLQVGCDADITIFDKDKVIDKANFDDGLKFSEGIEYVLVNGVFVVRNGKTVANTFPGEPVLGKYKK